mmetsp:Transcript_49544/g.140329  ORF Transcript_49544/g.140329 Transcript_49544/m.140329 type:complete len:208 (-) Transcript_49544:372-995(-)
MSSFIARIWNFMNSSSTVTMLRLIQRVPVITPNSTPRRKKKRDWVICERSCFSVGGYRQSISSSRLSIFLPPRVSSNGPSLRELWLGGSMLPPPNTCTYTPSSAARSTALSSCCLPLGKIGLPSRCSSNGCEREPYNAEGIRSASDMTGQSGNSLLSLASPGSSGSVEIHLANMAAPVEVNSLPCRSNFRRMRRLTIFFFSSLSLCK